MCRSNVVDLTQSSIPAAESQRLRPPCLVLRLAQLSAKYRTLMALRLQRETLESNGIFTLTGEARQERRSRSRALAHAFPGALRELDCRTAAALARCLRDLADERARAYARPDAAHPERLWVRAMLAYHAEMRRALARRNASLARHLGAQPRTARSQRFLDWYAAQDAEAPESTPPSEAPLPGGRAIVAHVCEAVALSMGCAAADVRLWVFGAEDAHKN